MDEATARNWDVGLKLVGLIGFAVGAAFSYFQYFDGVARQETTALIEAQKPFLAQRQDLYGQAVKAVAQLASSEDPTVLKDAEATFWALYWGPLATVESRQVEEIMVKMGQCLRDTGCGPAGRQAHSLALAHAVRQESADAWNVALPQLPQQRTTNPSRPE